MSETARDTARRLIRNNKLAYALLYPLIRLNRYRRDRKDRAFERIYDGLFAKLDGGSVVVKIPQFQGAFTVDVRSHTLKRAVMSRHDPPEHVRSVASKVDPDKDVLDVGANIGLYTVLFSKTVSEGRRILAVEPTRLAAGYLRSNVERNCREGSVIVFEGVATDTAGNYELNVIPGMEQYSSLGDMVHPSIRGKTHETMEVGGDTIDNLVRRHGLEPGFVKVDTEGAEYLVIKGAMETLSKYRPVLWAELSDRMLAGFGHTSSMVVALFDDLGYDVTDALNPGAAVTEPFEGEILATPRPQPR